MLGGGKSERNELGRQREDLETEREWSISKKHGIFLTTLVVAIPTTRG
jgi:hypothetical protein